jgi:hypothetical protein
MTTPTTPAPGTATPAQPSTPAEGATPQQATPAAPGKGLDAAVRRTVALKKQEAQLKAQAEALKPMQELQALMEKDPAEAFRRLAGDRFLDAYKRITNDVVGSQDEAAALEALPKSVREKLAKLEELEKRAPVVDDLQQRLSAMEQKRQEAEAALLSRQKQEAATRVYTAGFEAVKAAGDVLPLVTAHPKGEELVQEAWTGLLRERQAELAALEPQARQQRAAALVKEAAESVQARLESETGWVLQTPWAREKMGGVKGTPRGRPSAPATPGRTQPTQKPRTGTPGSLGEPAAVDLRKMTPSERIRYLTERERAGTLYAKK